MNEPQFNNAKRCYLKTEDGDKVILYEYTWKSHCAYPERGFIRYNFDKLKETLLHPDTVRDSRRLKTAKLYYKSFDKIMLLPKVTVPAVFKYIVVIVNWPKGKSYGVINSFYPTNKVK